VPRRCPVALKLSVEQRLSAEPENAFLIAGSTWSEFKVFSRVYFVIRGQSQFVNLYGGSMCLKIQVPPWFEEGRSRLGEVAQGKVM
jgi:hypothetical protein